MNTRKRKHREDDQSEEDLTIWHEAKRQQIKIEDVWTSSSEGCRSNPSEVEELSKTDSVDSDLECAEIFDGLGKKDLDVSLEHVLISAEDPSPFEDEADKENSEGLATPGHSSKENPGSSSARSLPQPPPEWLLTPPMSTRSKESDVLSHKTVFTSQQESPLPTGLGWADPSEVWDLMVSKDRYWGSLRDPDVFSKHPSLEPRMRSILLDWLIEVCEVYKLHRETYYLAQDFIDRFLAVQEDVPKQHLQLIGITCLFIAAKVEEIYPPKICEFAYVTDGACDEGEILDKELIILKTLNWDLSPVTVNSWLTIYLQLYGHDGGLDSKDYFEEDDKCSEVWPEDLVEECLSKGSQKPGLSAYVRRAKRRRGRRRGFGVDGRSILLKPPPGSTFVFPQFPGIALARAAQLADFATLDAQSLRFPYSLIAASTLYHVWSKEVALTVSGHTWDDIKPCVDWMSAFAITLKEAGAMSKLEAQLEGVWARLGLGSVGDGGNKGSALLRTIPHLVVDDSHNIQTHLVDLDLLEKAQERLNRLMSEQASTPPLVLTYSGSSSPSSTQETDLSSPASSLALLTPPASSIKSSSTSSSVTNPPVTPSTPVNVYHSSDFCLG
ncbi:hypothetical protein J437_LFUL013769 [Ladona fulva]|uniref:Cyclin N-terminal domain-containing protein n=1 Tax=Ladona fulva TaxID=123851 RepID=A0A8K0P578_LADFU|nr:hypothetical protein J437_LFUL013769 [Ladona fulva]